MEKTARTTFSDGEKYLTTKEVQLVLMLLVVSICTNPFIDCRFRLVPFRESGRGLPECLGEEVVFGRPGISWEPCGIPQEPA